MLFSCVLISYYHKVIRGNVPVDDIILMKFIQLQNQRFHQRKEAISRNLSAIICNFSGKSFAFYISHNQISGSMLAEVISYMHNIWALKSCKRPCFFQERCASPCKSLVIASGSRENRIIRC